MLKNLLFFLSIMISAETNNYDTDVKDAIKEQQHKFDKILQEQKKNGFILFNDDNDLGKLLQEIDEDGEKIPFLCLIFITGRCPNCRPFKQMNFIKNISNELNKILVNYINQQNSQNNYKMFFVLIDLDDRTDKLSKFIRPLSTINSIPRIYVVCRQKKCKHKNCQNRQKPFTVMTQKIGIYYPLEKWINEFIKDTLSTIVEHNFNKN